MSLLIEEYIKSLNEILERGDVESEQFNNALNIQTTIQKLHKKGSITDFDLQVLNSVASGFNFTEIGVIFMIGRKKISESFKSSCSKIAYVLGHEFTDIGFIYGVASRHAVGEGNKQKLKEFFSE